MKSSARIELLNPFTTLLTILFIGLKFTGYINWSWWWVLSPLWLTFIFQVLVIILVFLVLITLHKKGYLNNSKFLNGRQ